jgi:hypothetical protein
MLKWFSVPTHGRSGIYYIFIELETVRDVKMVLGTNHGRSGIYYIFIELETVMDVKMVLSTNHGRMEISEKTYYL